MDVIRFTHGRGGRRVMPLFLLLAMLLIIVAWYLLQLAPRLPHRVGDWVSR